MCVGGGGGWSLKDPFPSAPPPPVSERFPAPDFLRTKLEEAALAACLTRGFCSETVAPSERSGGALVLFSKRKQNLTLFTSSSQAAAQVLHVQMLLLPVGEAGTDAPDHPQPPTPG